MLLLVFSLVRLQVGPYRAFLFMALMELLHIGLVFCSPFLCALFFSVSVAAILFFLGGVCISSFVVLLVAEHPGWHPSSTCHSCVHVHPIHFRLAEQRAISPFTEALACFPLFSETTYRSTLVSLAPFEHVVMVCVKGDIAATSCRCTINGTARRRTRAIPS